jgi:hypothetical protein
VAVEFSPPSSSFSGKTLTETLSYGYTLVPPPAPPVPVYFVDIPLTGKVSKS